MVIFKAPLTFAIRPDDAVDPDGTIEVLLGADTNDPINYSVAPSPANRATIKIRDDDLPNLSIASESGMEGVNSANGSVVFTPTLDTAAGRDITITYSTTPIGDFPVESADYSPATNAEVTIRAGETTSQMPISISIIDDLIPEPDETFVLTYQADHANVANNTAIGTISNDDGRVLAINSMVVNEDVGTVNLKISLSPALEIGDTAIDVTYSTSDGTAVGSTDGNNADYTSISATTIEFSEEEKSKQVEVTISDDTLNEMQEMFSVVVSTTTGGITTYASGVGTLTINDNDSTLPALGFMAISGEISEGTDASTNTIHNIVVNLGTGIVAGREITADYTLSSGNAEIPMDVKLATTAPGRTSNTTGKITFAAGVDSVEIPVEIISDEYDEDNETFKITLATPTGATIGTESITGTIADDDDPPTVSIAESVTEVETDADFSGRIAVTLDRASTKHITVQYTVATGTAITTDFTLANGDVEFVPDPATKITPKTQYITYTIKGDNLTEAIEQFTITLSSPTNAVTTGISANITGTVRITDDDPELPILTIANATGLEGSIGSDGVVEFIPTLSTVSGQNVVVTYSTAPSGDFPVENDDYATKSNAKITIPAGQTTPNVPIRITTTGDLTPEPDETFSLSYSADFARLPAEPMAFGTINNDDGQVLAITSTTVNEDVDIASLTLTLSPAPLSGERVRVQYQSMDVTANGSSDGSNADFTIIDNTSDIFEEGDKSKQILVSITDDSINELQERFTVIVTTSDSDVTIFAGGVGTVRINDNDTTLPTMSLVDISGEISEGTSSSSNTIQNIQVSLGTDVIAGRDITANYTLSSDQAGIPVDVKLAARAPGRTSDSTGRLTFFKGTGSVNIPVEIVADDFDEEDETFKITLTQPTGATIGTELITATIDDDDDPPTVSIAAATNVTETDEDFKSTIAVSLDHNSGRIVTVPYTVAVDTATEADFSFTADRIIFTPDPTTKITAMTQNITFTIKGDNMNESLEQFAITLGTPTYATTTGANITGIITIVDDDQEFPMLTIADADGAEGDLGSDRSVEFMPTLSEVSGRKIVVTYSTEPGGDFPADTGDYISASKATITIPAGQTTPDLPIRITTTGDRTPEPDETFTLSYSADFARLPAEPIATGTITNDDAQVLAITSTTVSEGIGTANLEISLSPAPGSGETVAVSYETVNGTAEGTNDGTNADFTAISPTTIQFGEGQSSKIIAVTITNDSLNELQEMFTVVVSTATSDITVHNNGVGVIKIDDNDSTIPALSFSAIPGTITEGTNVQNNTIYNIMVNLGAGVVAGRDIEVDYTLSSEQAEIPMDIRLASTAPGRNSDSTGTIAFAKGTSSVSIPVEIIADAYDEFNETFMIALSNPVNATIDTVSISGTIGDDDDPPTVSIAMTTSEMESDVDLTGTISVSLDQASGKTVTVPYIVSPDTATLNDFILVYSPIEFTPDPITKITPISQDISYTIKGDNLNEATEQFTITLGTPTNGVTTGANITGTVTIADEDDELPMLTIADAEGVEGDQNTNGSVKLTPTLSTVSGRDVVVTYSTAPAGDFPVQGDDYMEKLSETVTIPAGRTTPVNPISITTVADAFPEPNETFSITYSADFASTPTRPIAMGTIVNDDGRVLTISSTTVSENVGTVDLKVTLTPAPRAGESVSVSYHTVNGTATGTTNGKFSDFISIASTTIQFAEGDRSKIIQLTIEDDTIIEESESFTVVVLTAAPGVTLHAGGIGTVMINDDDTILPALGFVATSDSITEGTDTTNNTINNIAVNLGSGIPAGREITVDYTLSSDNAYIPQDVRLATTAPGRTSETEGTITFAKGVSLVNIPVEIFADEFDEEDETFVITLSNPSNATIRMASITKTIADDDNPPNLSISVAPVTEGNDSLSNAEMVFTVSIDQQSYKDISVDYRTTTGGTATSSTDFSTTAGDFLAKSGTLEFTKRSIAESGVITEGITSRTIVIPIFGDVLDENNESIFVVLTSEQNAILPPNEVFEIGRITDDDALPELTITSASGNEGTASAETIYFGWSLSPVSGREITVNYEAISGLAISGTDFNAVPETTLRIPAGATSGTIPVSTIRDTKNEQDETFSLEFSKAVNVALTSTTIFGTILNDDLFITLEKEHYIKDTLDAEFYLRANVESIVDLNVSYEYNYKDSNGVDILDQWIGQTAIIPTGSRYTIISHEATYILPGSAQAAGTLNVRLLAGSHYKLGSKVEGDILMVADEATPLISISRVGSERLYESKMTATEPSKAKFEITARPLPATTKSVLVKIRQDGDYIAELSASGGELEKNVLVDEITGIGILEIAMEDDDDDEIDGSITATIQAGEGYHVGDITNQASFIVLDDDGDDTMPEISINSVSINGVAIIDDLTATEGQTIAIEFSSNIPVQGSNPLSINYEVTSMGDFFGLITSGATGIEIAVESTSTVIQFETINDEMEEANGALLITLLSGTGYFLASTLASDNSREITIADDDPTLTINSVSKMEGNSGENMMDFEVAISTAPLVDVTVAYATSNGSAIQSLDFFAISGILTFRANETTPKSITVKINPDSIDEIDESFNLRLSKPTGGAKIGGTGVAIGTIEDDDDPPILSINSAEIQEGQTGKKDLILIASLTHRSSRDVTFEYSTIGVTATAGEDFISISNEKATIKAGSISLPIEIKVNGDKINESDETFTIVLADAVNATISETANIGTGTIISDDQPAFHVINAKGIENTDNMIRFDVTLSPEHTEEVSVQFTTITGETDTAVSGEDFVSASETLVFKAGDRVKEVRILLSGDELDEEDEEFTVRLSNPSEGAFIVGNGLAKGQIIDDDGEINMSIADIELIEGNSGKTDLNFTVSLDSASGREVTVRYNTADPSAVDTASETDFDAVTGVLVFLPGVTARTISIPIIGDDEFETDEKFRVILSEATNANIIQAVGNGTILNDDLEIPRFSLNAGQKTTYNEGEVVEIELTAGLPYTIENEINLPINITQNGAFIRWRHSSVITVDGASEFIRIPTLDDAVVEENGSITVSIVKKEGEYTVDPVKSSVTVMILDNEDGNSTPQPQISVASQVANNLLSMINGEIPQAAELSTNLKPVISVAAAVSHIEEGAPIKFDIVSSEPMNHNLVIYFEINKVGDFISSEIPSQIVLPIGQSHSQVMIDTIDDTLAESDGQVSLTLIQNSTYQIGDRIEAIVYVSDQADRLRRSENISNAGQEVLSDLVGSIGARSISSVTSRVRSAFSATGPVMHLKLNGTDQITDLLTTGGEMINADSMSLRSILGNSSFTLDLFPEQGRSSLATIWGLGDHRDLKSSGSENTNSWDGDVFTGQIGFDAKVGTSILAGLSTSVIESDIKHDGVVDDGLMFRASSSALNSYFGWTSANQDTQLRSSAGYGLGDITLEQADYDSETLTSQYYTFGISGDHRLYSSKGVLSNGTTELNINGESWFANLYVNGIVDKISDLESSGNHYRIAAIGSHQFDLTRGSSFKPEVSFGVRRDQKNLDSKFGIELGSRLSYSDSFGFTFTGRSDTMLNYAEIQKWNLQGNLSYDYDNDKLGTLLKISPSIGHVHESSSNVLWSSDILADVSELGQYQTGEKVDTELGYGFNILEGLGVITPYGGIDFINNESVEYQIGTRVIMGHGMKLELTSSQQVSTGSDNKQDFQLTGGISW